MCRHPEKQSKIDRVIGLLENINDKLFDISARQERQTVLMHRFEFEYLPRFPDEKNIGVRITSPKSEDLCENDPIDNLDIKISKLEDKISALEQRVHNISINNTYGRQY